MKYGSYDWYVMRHNYVQMLKKIESGERVMNRAAAFAEGRRVMTTLKVPNARLANVSEYRAKYGDKAIYKMNGIEYVKPFIRVVAAIPMEV